MAKDSDTSWEGVAQWYDQSVGEAGHYYHQEVVIPGVLRLLALEKKSKKAALLDVACGQGVLARHLPRHVEYCGLDAAPALVKAAQQQDKAPGHRYLVADATEPLPVEANAYSHATIILALQNIEAPAKALAHLRTALCDGARCVIVLNHPCFRIPRQSSWGVEEEKKLQFRRIDHYMTPLKVPIAMNPGKGKQAITTYSFHHPLTDYFGWLAESGFCVEDLEEWCSPKQSTGKYAKMENRARREIPLFMALVARAVTR